MKASLVSLAQTSKAYMGYVWLIGLYVCHAGLCSGMSNIWVSNMLSAFGGGILGGSGSFNLIVKNSSGT